jgi:ribosome-associated translation inhibitor RaiA
MSTESTGQLSPDEVEVTAIGPVPDAIRVAARERVAHSTRLAGRPVRDPRVVVREFTNPGRVASSRVEISLLVGSSPVRTRGDAETPAEALDRAADRMERLIVELVNRWNERSRWLSVPAEGQWRSGDVPTERPGYAPRPVEDREVVRRKSFAVAPTSVDEAVYDMEALDHDFFLFTDAESEAPAVLSRTDNGYTVAGLPPEHPLPTGVTRAPAPPVLGEVQARQRLDVGGEPFVFYLDAESGNAVVLYRRYDGHYGLIAAT